MRLDDSDRRIIARLSRDGRASYREVGVEVGLSAPAVKRRVDRLRDAGVIEGFAAVVDPGALGWGTEAFIEVFCVGRTPPRRIADVVAGTAEVIGAYTITGDADALVHVRVGDTGHLERLLERLADEAFVARTRSVIVLSRLLERPSPDAAPAFDAEPTPGGRAAPGAESTTGAP